MITQTEIDLHHKECEDRKKLWGDGAWKNEPNRIEFEHAGLRCLLSRNHVVGFWCGYVGVGPAHAAFGRHYIDDIFDVLDVHGGLTYSDKCGGKVCHITTEKDELYWLGFDCGHSGDISPGSSMIHTRFGQNVKPRYETEMETYRTESYVRAQTRRLAEQLVTLDSKEKGVG